MSKPHDITEGKIRKGGQNPPLRPGFVRPPAPGARSPDAAIAGAVRVVTNLPTDEDRLRFLGELSEKMCLDCARLLQQNETCYCMRDE